MIGLTRLLALMLGCALVAECGGKDDREAAPPPSQGAGAPGAQSGGLPAVAGVPVYPGARYLEKMSKERSDLAGSAARLTGMDARVWIYRTDDSAEQVVRWYADKLGVHPAIARFDLGRIERRRAGEQGTEAHFTLAPLSDGREGSRSLTVLDRDVQLPPGGVKPGERARPRIVDETTIRIVQTFVVAGRRAPGEEPPR